MFKGRQGGVGRDWNGVRRLTVEHLLQPLDMLFGVLEVALARLVVLRVLPSQHSDGKHV
jgi:hypothetical protein